MERGTYDLDACLTLLRLYSFSPEHVNVRIMSKILIKAMLQLPSPDFALMLHLIPERLQVAMFTHCSLSVKAVSPRLTQVEAVLVQEEQPLAALIALTQHLEGARFQAFWLAADSCRDIVKSGKPAGPASQVCPAWHSSIQFHYVPAIDYAFAYAVPGFYDSVRAYILTAICSTFQKISKANLAESLRLEGAPLDQLVSCLSTCDAVVKDPSSMLWGKGMLTLLEKCDRPYFRLLLSTALISCPAHWTILLIC